MTQRVSRIAEPAVAAAFVVCLTAVLGGAFYPKIRLVVGCLLCLLAVLVALAGVVRLGEIRAEERLLLAVVAWGAISALLVRAMPLRAKEVLAAWLVTWLLWFVTRRAGKVALQAVRAILITVGGLLASAVIFEFLGMRAVRASGLLENANVTAALLVPTFALGVATVVARLPAGRRNQPHGSGEERYLGSGLLGATVVLAIGLLLTGSRAGLIAAVLAVVVMLPGKRLRFIVLVTGGAMITGLLVWRFSTHPEVLAWERSRIWLALLRLAADHPLLGVSPGALLASAGGARLTYLGRLGHHPYLATYAESTPLGLLIEVGAVGALLFITGGAMWLRRMWVSGRLQAPQLSGPLAAMVVIGTFHDLVEVEVVLWWWVLLLAAGEAAPGGEPARSCRTAGMPVPIQARLVGGLSLAGLLLWCVVQPALAGVVWWQAQPTAERTARVMRIEPWFGVPATWRTTELLRRPAWNWREAAAAMVWSRRAVTIQPGLADGWSNLAQVHFRVASELMSSPEMLQEARQGFARAAELEPHLPWYWIGWAQVERAGGRLEKSRALVMQAISAEPNCIQGWLLLARIELDLGRIEPARRALAEARAVRRRSQQYLLDSYDRELLLAPARHWHELEMALP